MKKFPNDRILSDYAPKTSGFAFGGNVSGGGSAAQTDKPLFGNFGTAAGMIETLNNTEGLTPEVTDSGTDYRNEAGRVAAHIRSDFNAITMYNYGINGELGSTVTYCDSNQDGTLDNCSTETRADWCK